MYSSHCLNITFQINVKLSLITTLFTISQKIILIHVTNNRQSNSHQSTKYKLYTYLFKKIKEGDFPVVSITQIPKNNYTNKEILFGL